jgi:hypothetical protein
MTTTPTLTKGADVWVDGRVPATYVRAEGIAGSIVDYGHASEIVDTTRVTLR